MSAVRIALRAARARFGPSQRDLPECGNVARRLLGAPALKSKGSGWYVNDYGKGNGSRPAESDKPTPAAKDADDAKKSLPKTEKKADKKADAA